MQMRQGADTKAEQLLHLHQILTVGGRLLGGACVGSLLQRGPSWWALAAAGAPSTL